jgi:hypothetical protein
VYADGAATGRKVAFLNAFGAMLEYFKSLMTPYLSVILPPLVVLLKAFARDAEEVDEDLWPAVLDTLAKSFVVDEGGASFSSSLHFSCATNDDVQCSGARTSLHRSCPYSCCKRPSPPRSPLSLSRAYWTGSRQRCLMMRCSKS